MKYFNTKTKAVIETACIINGEYWQLLEKQPKAQPEEIITEEPKKGTKRTKKK